MLKSLNIDCGLLEVSKKTDTCGVQDNESQSCQVLVNQILTLYGKGDFATMTELRF